MGSSPDRIGRYPGTVLYGWWWLRSPGIERYLTVRVNDFLDGWIAWSDEYVPPALWVDLSALPDCF